MIAGIFFVLCAVSLICGAALGNMEAVAVAALDGAQAAVTLTLSLCGVMGLWSGVCRVLQDAGAVAWLARRLRPVLRFLFPGVAADSEAGQAIVANLSANLLGIGNAATPLGIRAMKALRERHPADWDGRADGDMIALAVMNTAPLSLLPTTVLALRRGAGSVRPFCVVVPVWLCSGAGAVLMAVLLRLLRAGRHGGEAGD